MLQPDRRPMKMLHVTTREAWRAWLREHHDRETEVWLVYNKRHTGRRRVEYGDAVREALCFGWIDSIVRRLDGGRYAQKFTPRKPRSRWSALNRRRFASLVEEGGMTKAGLASAPPRKTRAEAAEARRRRGPVVVPAYLVRALKTNRRAWRHFDALAPSYRRLYVLWIDAAKTAETRARRIAEARRRLAQNTPLGLK